MYGTADYAQPLRAIGQALETLKVETFEMEPAGDAYLIRGAAATSHKDLAPQGVSVEKLRLVWGIVPGQNATLTGVPKAKNVMPTSPIELNYTPKDVERLELEGRSKRGSSTKAADPASLSQLLRCIGAYLTQKLARLLRLSWAGNFLLVEYETSLGSRMQETLAAADLYDLWVRMYLQRSSRLA
ncbi:MAG TPA: hypothetical protein VMT22_23755 [Terriglobales bacterium]|jgi:hypothetical protein|nr:hypothetical protein [Terriglobales bacterium]